MESGGSFEATMAARSDVVIEEGSVVNGEGSAASENNMPEANEYENAEPNLRNPEEYIPISSIMRIMRRALPAQMKVSDDAKEKVLVFVTEFISFVTNEANARCQRESRKTITVENVLSALAALGFDDYVQPLCVFMNNHREKNPGRHASRGVYAPPARMIAPASYVDPEVPPPRVDGGESSSGGPSAQFK